MFNGIIIKKVSLFLVFTLSLSLASPLLSMQKEDKINNEEKKEDIKKDENNNKPNLASLILKKDTDEEVKKIEEKTNPTDINKKEQREKYIAKCVEKIKQANARGEESDPKDLFCAYHFNTNNKNVESCNIATSKRYLCNLKIVRQEFEKNPICYICNEKIVELKSCYCCPLCLKAFCCEKCEEKNKHCPHKRKKECITNIIEEKKKKGLQIISDNSCVACLKEPDMDKQQDKSHEIKKQDEQINVKNQEINNNIEIEIKELNIIKSFPKKMPESEDKHDLSMDKTNNTEKTIKQPSIENSENKNKSNVCVVEKSESCCLSVPCVQKEVKKSKIQKFKPEVLGVNLYNKIDLFIQKSKNLDKKNYIHVMERSNKKIKSSNKKIVTKKDLQSSKDKNKKIIDVGMYDHNGKFMGVCFKKLKGWMVYSANGLKAYDCNNMKCETFTKGDIIILGHLVGRCSNSVMNDVKQVEGVVLYDFEGNIIGRQKSIDCDFNNTYKKQVYTIDRPSSTKETEENIDKKDDSKNKKEEIKINNSNEKIEQKEEVIEIVEKKDVEMQDGSTKKEEIIKIEGKKEQSSVKSKEDERTDKKENIGEIASRVRQCMFTKDIPNIEDVIEISNYLKDKKIDNIDDKVFIDKLIIVINYYEILFAKNQEYAEKLALCKKNLEGVSFGRVIDSKNDENDPAMPDFYSCENDLANKPKLVEKIYNYAPDEIKEFVKDRDYRKKFKKQPAKSSRIILYGANGTGKTVIGKAVAAKLGIKYHEFECTKISTKFAHSGPENFSREFKKRINLNEPCVVVFDEADGLNDVGNKRNPKENPDEAPISKTVGLCLDKCENYDIIFIFITNHIENISKTIKSKAKPEKEILLPKPEIREDIIKYYLLEDEGHEYDLSDNIKYIEKKLNWKSIRKETDGFDIRLVRDLAEMVRHYCESIQRDKKLKNLELGKGQAQIEELIISNEHFEKIYKLIRNKKKSLWSKFCEKYCNGGITTKVVDSALGTGISMLGNSIFDKIAIQPREKKRIDEIDAKEKIRKDESDRREKIAKDEMDQKNSTSEKIKDKALEAGVVAVVTLVVTATINGAIKHVPLMFKKTKSFFVETVMKSEIFKKVLSKGGVMLNKCWPAIKKVLEAAVKK